MDDNDDDDCDDDDDDDDDDQGLHDRRGAGGALRQPANQGDLRAENGERITSTN